ncbi:MAG: hypothetical protein QMD09_13645, partial [Desulfatibacillaceae bacterium]|nr:hypothetical protein [Desulfatibacillaceae bacterium]
MKDMWRKLFLLIALMALLSACDSSSPYAVGDELIVHLNAQGNIAWVTKGDKNYIIDVANHPTAKIDQSSVDILAPNDLNQANYPTGWIFPDGLPAFTIYDLAPAGGDSLTVTIIYPSAYPAGAVYYKVTANGFAPYTPAVISGNTVLLPLTDGGSGDSDAVNGQITDPGGPAVCKSIGWAVGDATGGYGTILKTKDGGMNWVRQGDAATVPDANLNGVAVLDKDTLWVVGDFSEGSPTILRSEDGGQTWVRQGENDNLPQSGLLDIYALNRD